MTNEPRPGRRTFLTSSAVGVSALAALLAGWSEDDHESGRIRHDLEFVDFGPT